MTVDNLNVERLHEVPAWTWDDSRDYFIPVSIQEGGVLPMDTDVMFVLARFSTPGGKSLDGIIINPPVPYGVEIFVGQDSVGFNRNAPEFAAKELARLFELLGEEPFQLFPLRYGTDLHFPGEPNIAGVFDIDVERT